MYRYLLFLFLLILSICGFFLYFLITLTSFLFCLLLNSAQGKCKKALLMSGLWRNLRQQTKYEQSHEETQKLEGLFLPCNKSIPLLNT